MTTQSNAFAIPPERDTTPSLMSESGVWAPPVPSSIELEDADVLDDESDADLGLDLGLGWDVEIPIDAASGPALPALDALAYDANDEAPFALVAPSSAPARGPASKPAAMSVPAPDVRVPGPEKTMLFMPSIRTRLWVSE